MSSELSTPSSVRIELRRFEESDREVSDVIAVEEPLEIRLQASGERDDFSLSVTMRTPGEDEDLAAGFLFTEGIVDRPEEIEEIRLCPPNQSGSRNVVRAELADGVSIDRKRLTRHVYTTSSCGVCGKTSIDAVRVSSIHPLPPGEPVLSRSVVESLPGTLRRSQRTFEETGGVHAAALFDLTGALLAIREDVGRHNAVDKLIGAFVRQRRLPLSRSILMVSGRAGFELVQKAVRAGIPVMAAVSAPSSLALQLARESGMTLLGFVRDGRFNCYSGPYRID